MFRAFALKSRTDAMTDRIHRIILYLSELALLLPLILITGGIYLLIRLTDAVSEGSTQRFDDFVLRSLRHPDNPAIPIGPQWLTEIARDITALGGVAVLVLTTLAVTGFLLLEHKRRATALIIVSSIGGLLVSLCFKHIIDRPRPELVPHLSGAYTSSFPSGHSMLSAIVYLTLGALLARTVKDQPTRIYCMSVATFLSLLVGLSRIYMGVHYPTDVLAGWTAGALWALICWTIASFLQQRGAIEQPR